MLVLEWGFYLAQVENYSRFRRFMAICSSRRATPFLDSTRPLNNERTSSSLV